MPLTDILIFAVTLFLALAALLRWKHRRDKISERMNQKLRGFMAVEGPATSEATPEGPEPRESAVKVA